MKDGLALALVATIFATRPSERAPAASYSVAGPADGSVLTIEATFSAGAGSAFVVDQGAGAYVSAVEVIEPPGAGIVARGGNDWMLPCAPCSS